MVVDQRNPGFAHLSAPRSQPLTLNQWVRQSVGVEQVRSRLQGNNLHILLEADPCPNADLTLSQLESALAAPTIEPALPADATAIHRVVVHGRVPNTSNPGWTRTFYLNQPASPAAPPAQPTAPAIDLTPELDQQTALRAIAHHLSLHLSSFGIAIKVRSQPHSPTPPLPHSPTPHRLIITCQASYPPNAALLADPIAQRLRELNLQGFQDAIVLGQVSGEAQPEWLLRIDLTPPEQILREWARWGDVQALTRLLNQALQPQQAQLSALLKEVTLHLTCQGQQAALPDQASTIATITPILDALIPQGIQAVAVYGLESAPAAANPATPRWVEWITIPTTEPTLDLAKQGNLETIGFLLTRLLNPDLDAKLATGGIRVQVRQKADVLHVMTDAPTCPEQSVVGSAVARCLQPIQIATIAGVRVYGRRAGQKQPLWSYGVDFVTRPRLVPEVTPEFAASDAYVGDLLTPGGALALRSEFPEPDSWLKTVWEQGVQKLRRSFLASHLFLPLDSEPSSAIVPLEPDATAEPSHYRGAKVALVWATAGLLLTVQGDWILGRLLQPSADSAAKAPASGLPAPSAKSAPSPPSALQPGLALQKQKSPDGTAFSSSGFTRKGPEAIASSSGSLLPASPPQVQSSTIVAQTPSDYPTFNSRQLDEKLMLYRRLLTEHGRPDVLIIGSSRALRGIDPAALQARLAELGYPRATVFNFGINGATAQVADMIVRQMLPQEALPKLILFADGARAFNSGRQDTTYNGIVASQGYRTLAAGKPPIPGTLLSNIQAAKTAITKVDATVTSGVSESPGAANRYQEANQALNKLLGSVSLAYPQRDRLKLMVHDRLVAWLPTSKPGQDLEGTLTLNQLGDTTSPAASAANSPPPVLPNGLEPIDVSGFLSLPNRFNPATYYQKYARVPGDYDSDYESFSLEGKQSEALTNLAQFTQARQIPLVLVNLPLTNEYLDPVRKRYDEQFQQYIFQRSTQLGLTYRDLSQALLTQPDYFSDPSHLNRYGGYEISRRLAQDAMIPWSQIR